MKRRGINTIIISLLIFGLDGSSAVLAIEDTGTNIWNGTANSLYQFKDSDQEKLREYKNLYDYYLSRNEQEKANLCLEKIKTILNQSRLW